MVTLDAKSIVEKMLLESEWEHLCAADLADAALSEAEVATRVASLNQFCVDVAADGAELTSSRGMIIQGLKFVSPQIVSRLVPQKTSTRSTSNSVSGASSSSAVDEPLSIDELSSELDELCALNAEGK